MKTLRTIYTNFAKRNLARLLTIFIILFTLSIVHANATTVTDKVYTFGSSSTPSGWRVNSSNSHASGYLKFSANDYLEMTVDDIFAEGEILSSNTIKVDVSCGTFGTWSSPKSVLCSVELRTSNGDVLTTNNATFSNLNNSESTYRTPISVDKPNDPSKIAYLRITFSNFTSTSTGTLRVKYIKLNYETSTPTPSGYAVTYNNGGRGTAPVDETATSVTLSEITATGYTNTGWKADVAVKNGSTTISAETLIENGTTVTLTQATTFTAQWQINSYTVTWKPNGGNWSGNASDKVEDYNYGATITTPTNPTRYGYNFTGWNPTPATTMPASDQIYTAQWTEKALTNYRTSCTTQTLVSLHPNGGTISEDGWELVDGLYKQTTTESNIELPTITKGNWTFAGWDKDDDGETDYGATETITLNGTDVELSALWECTSLLAPTGLDAEPTSDGGRISWNQVTNATGYEISTDGGNTWGLSINGGSNTSHTLTNRECETPINWQVRAVGNTENGYCEENPAASHSFTTLECGCPSYAFHYGTNEQDNWNEICFEAVGDYDEMQIANFEIPSTTHYYVGKPGYNDNYGNRGQVDGPNSQTTTWDDMYLAMSLQSDNANGSPKLGQATGAVGTIRIFANSTWNNKQVAFIPDGYGVTFVEQAISYAFHKTTTDNKWETDALKLPDVANNKYTVGLATQTEGEYVASNHSNAAELINKMGVTEVVAGKKMIYFKPGPWNVDDAKFAIWDATNSIWGDGTTKLLTDADGDGVYGGYVASSCKKINLVRLSSTTTTSNIDWSLKWNQTGDITLSTDGLAQEYTITGWGENDYAVANATPKTGQNGKFRMWDNSTNKNWFVHFIPYYLLSYDANGGEGEMRATEYNTEDANNNVIVSANDFTRTGYDFVSWNTKSDGMGTSYAANATYTLSADATLYAQWQTQAYDITYMDQGNVAFSGENTTSLPATHTYGTATVVPDGVKKGYTFGGWYDNPDCTGTSINQLGATDYTSDITLYAKWTAKPIPTLVWKLNGTDITEHTVTIASESNVFPTLETTLVDLAEVEYSSSNTDVATIDDNGNIILKSAGNTTIRAYYVEGDIYADAEAAYTLKVKESTNCRWEEVTIDDIEYGDEVVIAMKTDAAIYAMSINDDDTATPEATIVTPSNFATDNGIGVDLTWYIEKDVNGKLIIRPKKDITKNVYCNTSENNDRVRVGNRHSNHEQYKTFEIDGNYLKNSSVYYIGVNISKGQWWGYANNSNIPFQTLKFYKRVCLPEGQYWVKWMVNGQEYTVGNPTTMVTDGQIKAIPTNPANDAIGDCADTFMGWSESNLGSAEGQSAPTDLFTTLAEAQELTINENKTFYAVFATVEGSATDFKRVTSLDELSDGTSIVIASTKSSKFMTYSTAFGSSTWSESNGKITATDNMIFTLVAKGDTWRIQKGTNIVSYEGRATSSPYCKPLLMNSNIKDWILLKNTSTTNSFTFYYEDGDYDYAIEYYSNESNWYAYSNKDPKSNDYYALALYVPDVTYSNYVTQCCTDWTPTLTYSKTTLDSETNEKATPTITGNTHNAPVSFESSNTSVLTVDANNGTITAVGAGKATITATWAKTGDYCEKSITTDEITVNGNFLVTFHANDGSGTTTTQQIPSNTATALKANTFQRDGYTFQGWATSASGAKEYDDKQEVTLSTSGLDLYAVWQVKAYKITIGTFTGNGTITTSPANSANCDAQVTITATPAAHYTLASVTVTRDDNSQTVAVVDNKFTMPASDVTITAEFTENEKFAINYAIPTGGGTLTDNAPTFIYIDGSITLPGIKDGTISSEYSCEEFIGWTTNPANHEAAGLKPEPFYDTDASFSNVSEDVTFYPVYSRPGAGVGGTVTLTEEEMYGWEDASYGTQRDLTTCVGTWTTTGYKNGSHAIQLKSDGSPYVKFPDLSGNITQVVLNATKGTTTTTLTEGTFTLKTEGGTTIASESVNGSGICTIPVTGSYTTAYLYSSATARITNIAITYGPPAIISTTLDCSSDVDECTITYDLNESFLAAGTQILGSCHNSTFKFSEVGTYTICSEPQANEYKLIGWNNQCDGKGSLTYTPGQEITSLPQNIITLYAQWAPEVIVHDSYEETKVYPTAMGGSITLNSGQYACDPKKYDFIGWTTDDPQLWQQNTTPPALLTDNGDGTVTFTPEEPSQVYAVYAIEDLANSDAFKLSSIVDGTKYYVGFNEDRNGRVKTVSTEADALTFYKEETTGDDNYLISYIIPATAYNDPGTKQYLYYYEVGSTKRLQITTNPDVNQGWTLVPDGDGYKFRSIQYNSVYLSMTSGNVQTNGTGNVFNMETVAEYKYIAKTNCSENVTITFVPGNGTMTPSTNPVTAKTGDIITLPTCTYEGWTFLGWVTENIELTELEIDPSRLYTETYEVGNSDVTLYAYYTQTPTPADFDGTTSGTWKMYTEVSTDVYKYALSHGSSRPATLSSTEYCPNATEWTFTNTGEANVYYIQDEDNLYLAPGESYGIEHFIFTSTPFTWKVIEVDATNTYRIYRYDTRSDSYERLIMSNQSGLFYHSAKINEKNSNWYHVTIGGCTNPVYTTDPQPSKIISLVGSPMITSTIGQTVKASQKLQLVIKDMDANADVTIAADGLTFYDTDNNVVNTLQTGPNGSLTATFTVAYTPTVADNQIVNPAITVTCGSASRTFYNVSCRSLPTDFVIAAKTGNSWVALTANITSTGTQAAPLIMVDNIALPTKATITPNTTKYQLLGLQTDKPSKDNSRFKNNGAAVHLYSTNVSQVISASTSTDNNKTYINADATHESAANSPNCLFYEWQLQTNDLVHYTLVNSNTTNTSNTKLGYSATYAQWGMYQTGNNVIQEVLLLPIEKDITEMDVEVMEWGTNSMALRFGSEAPATVDITLGATTTKALSLANLNSGNTSDIYKVEGLSLAGNDCEALLITDANDASKGKLIRKPILVSGDKNGSDYTIAPTRDVCMHSDIVILNGGKLVADEAKTVGSHVDFANIYVYPGGKLVLDDKSLGVKRQVYLRGGYSWLNSTYALPEVYVNGDINFNGSGNMIYDYYIQNQKYYQFALPYNVQLDKVTDESGADDFPVWVKHYNGDLRAKDAYATSWEWYPSENGDANRYFEAGIGYIIAAKPRQVGNVANRPLSIIRFPLSNDAFKGGEGDKSVVTIAHGIDGYKAGTVTANNVGWNFIGNPFMATWKGDIGHKELTKHPDEDNWDGSYHWVDLDVKYITIMSPEDGSDYAQTRADVADLKPFFPFYIQETADGGSGTINFAAANRVKKAPALWNVEQDEREAYIQIEIAMDAVADQTGVFVSNKYSDEIDFDDYEKMFGSSTDKPKVWLVHDNTRLAFEAMTENRATGMTPLGYRAPQDGEYMLVLNDEVSQLNNVESIYLTDYETGVTDYDLTSSAYEFESTTTLYNDTRFTIRIVMRDNTQGSITGIENIVEMSEHITKFIYQDKIYILHHGVIYDATGKRVITINK